MGVHPQTFEYLKPNEQQLNLMSDLRIATRVYADTLSKLVPEGASKVHLMRLLREVGMWANDGVMRQDDGSPR